MGKQINHGVPGEQVRCTQCGLVQDDLGSNGGISLGDIHLDYSTCAVCLDFYCVPLSLYELALSVE